MDWQLIFEKSFMYKLVVTDIDGTLLDNQSRLSELNRKAIMYCRQEGIEVILATGKSIHTITGFIEMFKLTLPQITLNGGVVFQPGVGILETNTLTKREYFELINAIKDYGESPTAALIDGRVVYDTYHPDMIHIRNAQVELSKVDRLEDPEIAGCAVSVHVPVKESHPIDAYLRKLFGDRLFVVRSGEYFFDFLKKDVSKGSALRRIMKKHGFRPEEVVAFGDSYNDLSLFEIAGTAVAMKNSCPQVLKSADIVTEDNHQSGLGKAIFKHVLDRKAEFAGF